MVQTPAKAIGDVRKSFQL